jgi:predicted RNA-binding Zn-ribbon protein involved in translation (DUF1610 family)
MPINMSCPSCAKVLAAPDSAVGKRAKCPACGQIMIVPDAVRDTELVGDHGGQHSFPSSSASGPAGQAGPWLGDTPATGAEPTVPGDARRPCPECGEMIIASAAKCRFCSAIFDPRLRGRSYRALAINLGPPGEYAKKIRFHYNLWWICLAIGAAIAISAGILAAATETPEIALVAIVGLIVAIVGGISNYILLYQLWKVVQDGRAQTTPGCAVGFLFIPCFNIYWQFVAIWGLAKELNRISREYHIGAPEANESLAMTECILFCCGIVPYIGALGTLAAFIISFIVMKNMCDVAAVIAETQTVSTT